MEHALECPTGSAGRVALERDERDATDLFRRVGLLFAAVPFVGACLLHREILSRLSDQFREDRAIVRVAAVNGDRRDGDMALHPIALFLFNAVLVVIPAEESLLSTANFVSTAARGRLVCVTSA